MSSVIQISNLYKEYRLGTIGYGTLREDLESWWAGFRGKPDPNSIIGHKKQNNRNLDRILALNNINLEVNQGDRLGIIGKNGAGKTTLLKILSRIAYPTKGSARITGRIASLIALGTGFHPELTGRENIYLNGAIMGLTKREITQRFDEIIDFSGVEQFIDTPVKRYSSGMYIRLGFAVAAHLDPDILIIDEVLAVGDADFQEKALGQMQKASNDEGKTILFVSHNLGMITSLCQNTILLEDGNIIFNGTATNAVKKYLCKGDISPCKVDFTKSDKIIGDEHAILLRASIKDAKENNIEEIDIRESFTISMEYKIIKNTEILLYPNFHLFDEKGQYIFVVSTGMKSIPKREMGVYEAKCIVPGNYLNNGIYFVGLALGVLNKGTYDSFYEKDALSFTIIDPIEETLYELRNGYSGIIPGPVRPQLDWEITKLE